MAKISKCKYSKILGQPLPRCNHDWYSAFRQLNAKLPHLQNHAILSAMYFGSILAANGHHTVTTTEHYFDYDYAIDALISLISTCLA
jgi:hypothetical protein